MLRSLPLATILLAALVVLAPLALASPPDQILIGGVFDGDDCDDVVAATSCDGAVIGGALYTGHVPLPGVGRVVPVAAICSAGSPAPVLQSRAPPFP